MRRTGVLALVALVLVPGAAWPQGLPLGPEFRVNTYATNAQRLASVASDSSGNFVVVWDSYTQDGSSDGVFGQRYDSSGVPLGTEFRVNTYTTNSQCCPSVTSDVSGNFVVVWAGNGQDGSSNGVFGQRYASSGAPIGPEFQVNTYTTGRQDSPSVASDASGNLLVAWMSEAQDGSLFGVFGQRFASSGAPLGPEFRVNTFTTGFQEAPSVASDPSGDFIVVWQDGSQDGSLLGVFGQRYASSGTPLGPEFRVNTHTTNGQSSPDIAADSPAGFVVVWQSDLQDGSGSGVFGQRFASSGAAIGPEFRVNTFTTTHQGFPSVASDSTGDFVVVWDAYLQDGSVLGVFGQRYASSGTPLGPEFRVNSYTTGYQAGSSVAAALSGSFVVVWASSGQDGSTYGVFGQRYDQIVPVQLMRFGVE